MESNSSRPSLAGPGGAVEVEAEAEEAFLPVMAVALNLGLKVDLTAALEQRMWCAWPLLLLPLPLPLADLILWLCTTGEGERVSVEVVVVAAAPFRERSDH